MAGAHILVEQLCLRVVVYKPPGKRCQPSDVLDDESSLSMSGSASLSGADRAVGSVAEALSEYENHENVANFRTLLRRVLNGGHSIDMKMANDQTLLHHAVSLDLVKEVLRILNCGAILVENKYGKIAKNNILQMTKIKLKRRILED